MSLTEAFLSQSRACTNLGSPFMGRLMQICADRLDRSSRIGATIHDWAGDPHHSADSVPLRLAGALHRLVREGADKRLAAVYPPNDASDDELWAAVAQSLDAQAEPILAMLASAPQTNEIRRSAALIPAFHQIARETGLPLYLSELGASAGLNLLNDRFHLCAGETTYGPPDSTVRLAPDWQGTAPPDQAVRISGRAGVDLNPIDLADAAERLRLISYLWPDQAERISNTEAAIALALADPPQVDKGDAIDWLAQRLDAAPAGSTHVVYHTIAWQYFPKAKQAAGEALLASAGAAATEIRPLARLAMEADGTDDGAGLSLQIWPNGEKRELARVCFHGRWIRWHA